MYFQKLNEYYNVFYNVLLLMYYLLMCVNVCNYYIKISMVW